MMTMMMTMMTMMTMMMMTMMTMMMTMMMMMTLLTVTVTVMMTLTMTMPLPSFRPSYAVPLSRLRHSRGGLEIFGSSVYDENGHDQGIIPNTESRGGSDDDDDERVDEDGKADLTILMPPFDLHIPIDLSCSFLLRCCIRVCLPHFPFGRPMTGDGNVGLRCPPRCE